MTYPNTAQPDGPSGGSSTAAPLSAWAGAIAYAARLRWVPLALAAAISIAMSFDAPHGRKPFFIDWDVSTPSLAFSLVKEPHIGASALIGMLAALAARRSRWWLALLLTVAIGAGWEMGQTTVIGHSARLADLLPDALGGALGVIWGALMLRLAAGIRDG